jgi:streptogramin lyase
MRQYSLVVLALLLIPMANSLQAGDLLVSLLSEPSVKRFNAAGSLLSTLTIPGLTGGSMRGMTIGPDGNLYVSYSTGTVGGSRIARFDGTTYAYIDTLVAPGAGSLASPVGLTFGPGGDLLVVDASTANVKRFNGVTGASMGDVFPPLLGGLTTPQDIIYEPGVGLLVSDIAFIGKVNRYTIAGDFVDVFISSPELDSASEMIPAPGGGILVSSFDNDRVLLYDGTTGSFGGIVIDSGMGGLDGPRGLAFDGAGHLLVSSQFTHEVLKYDYPTGTPLGAAVTLPFSNNAEFLLNRTVPEPGAEAIVCVVVVSAIRRQRLLRS